MNIPGRTCPMDYGIDIQTFSDTAADIKTDALYVVGGLYGNLQALEKILSMAYEEKVKPIIVFNGDIHWFDKNINDFKKIEKIVLRHLPLLGNVEAELVRNNDINAGCGCAYPSCVDDDTVRRSNLIHSDLKKILSLCPSLIQTIKRRKKAVVASVKNKRVAITHGDETSLAGWKCSAESLKDGERQREICLRLLKSNIDIFACTHTCSPAAFAKNGKCVINNGSSGMPNFKKGLYGLLTSISENPHVEAVYRVIIDDLYIEALPILYDTAAFLSWFDNIWPIGSPASISYRNRIVNGTELSVKDAIIEGFYIV
ncbi:hypothetical protein [Treponema pedis]|uniref:Calcineurin-like phosphoesterase domain-containing protein n=1 Tax=Treponema pedis str. T A4 TaxID=1291379 RepID=S5ZVD5_9SPIR|nr:hypothetical protein [Treponema pedis]AGT44240.1 hypothetical protein TPE_1766 [Treponema pedis str. T A4]